LKSKIEGGNKTASVNPKRAKEIKSIGKTRQNVRSVGMLKRRMGGRREAELAGRDSNL
jgi:hypothetical protein